MQLDWGGLGSSLWKRIRAVDVGAGISFSRKWAGSTLLKGGDDTGRMEGFVPAGPRLALKANARLGLRIKTSARDGLLGVSWAPGVLRSFPFGVLRDFGVQRDCFGVRFRRRGLVGSHSRWIARSSAECGGGGAVDSL